MPDDLWLNPVESDWTVKDLIGHLAAWSNLLLDQIEALLNGNAEKIEQIDIDRWNAAQVALRRDWPIAQIRREWQQSHRRAQTIVEQLPATAYTQHWPVAWAEEPVTINDLLHLWLLHLEQHQQAWQRK